MATTKQLKDVYTALGGSEEAIQDPMSVSEILRLISVQLGGAGDCRSVNEALAEIIVNLPSDGDNSVLDSVLDRSIVTLQNNTVTTFGSFAFAKCIRLETVDAASVIKIGQGAFTGCAALSTLVLRSGDVAELGTQAFSGTCIESGTGYIYVPDALVDSYKAAENWSTYADRIKPLSEYTPAQTADS